MGPSFEPIGAFEGAGAVSYSPMISPAARGFGVWEVHPNKTQTNDGKTVSLEWNGEYLAVGRLLADDGLEYPYSLACRDIPGKVTARVSAEILCALRNGDAPTRVVDCCGIESVSQHTKSSLSSAFPAAFAE